jgi:hypothetical protein
MATKRRKKNKSSAATGQIQQERRTGLEKDGANGVDLPPRSIGKVLTEKLPKLFPWALLCLIMAVGLHFRLSTTRWQITSSDTVQYLALARDIRDLDYFNADYSHGQGIAHSRELIPGYPFLIALFSFLPADLEVIGSCISITLSVLSFIPIFFIGRCLHSYAAGLFGAAIFAFQPFGLCYASYALTESTFSFFYIGTVALGLLTLETKRMLFCVLTGMFSALAYLTREVGIITLPALIFWMLLYFTTIRKLAWPRIVAMVATMTTIFVVVSAPFLINVKIQTGHFGLSFRRSTGSLIRLVNPIPELKKLADNVFKSGKEKDDENITPSLGDRHKTITENNKKEESKFKKVVAVTAAYKNRFKGELTNTTTILIIMSWLGAVVEARRRRSWKIIIHEIYLLTCIIQLLFAYGLLTPRMVDVRYTYPLLMPSFVFCGTGFARWTRWLCEILTSRLRSSPYKLFAGRLLTTITAMTLIGIIYDQNISGIRLYKLAASPKNTRWRKSSGHKEAAKYLIKNGYYQDEEIEGILCRKLYMAYYLNRPAVIVPETLKEIMEWRGSNYLLVADSTLLHRYRYKIAELAIGLPRPFPGPIPGRIIYSRLFPEYSRVITVYDLRYPEHKRPPPAANIEERLNRAYNLYESGFLWDATLECLEVVLKDPEHVEAYRMLAHIFWTYYQVTELPVVTFTAVKLYKKYLSLNPDDARSRERFERIRDKMEEYIEKGAISIVTNENTQ